MATVTERQRARRARLDALRASAAELREHGVARAGVFGSAARGGNGPASDVDVVLVLQAGLVPDLMALVRLKLRVGDIVGHALDGSEVDVAIRDHMHAGSGRRRIARRSMPNKRPRRRLADIRDDVDRIESHVAGLTFQQ